MHAERIEPVFAPPLEIRNPDAPGEVVRIGPTLTQVMGFGPSAEVAAWIDRTIPTVSALITADAFDDARTSVVVVRDERGAIEAALDELESRAEVLEHRINAIDNGELDGGPTTELAAVAMGLAIEWETGTSPTPAPTVASLESVKDQTGDVSGADPCSDSVVAAHHQVEVARAAVGSASASELREARAHLDAARRHETAVLRDAGVATYAQYVKSIGAQSAPLSGLAIAGAQRVLDPGAVLIQRRAKTAQVLGRLAGSDPATELREFAQRCLQGLGSSDADPEERDRLLAELDEIDLKGQQLADELAHPTTPVAPTNAQLLSIIFAGAEPTIVIDGDLLYACSSDQRDALLEHLHDESMRRRVVLVSDDTLLDAYVASIPRGMLWSSGHLHLVQRGTESQWSDDPEIRGASLLTSLAHGEALSVCSNHAGTATRLTCPTCERPFCSLCLIGVDRRAVECVACALGRGGVRPRRWRH